MTATDIERLEQAARSVFGHDDGEAALSETKLRFRDRIRNGILRLFSAPGSVAPGV